MWLVNQYKLRKTWVALLLALVTTPAISMLYLGRWKMAVFYFIVFLSLEGLAYLSPAFLEQDTIGILYLLLMGVAIVHIFCLARRFDPTLPVRWYSRWYGLLLAYMVFFIAMFAGIIISFTVDRIPSGSMSPTINAGDYVFSPKYSGDSTVSAGDIIRFSMAGNPNNYYVKRVIGMPGDRIQLKDGVLYINGVAAEQTRVENFSYPSRDGTVENVPQYNETLTNGRSYHILDTVYGKSSDNTPVYTVPANHYFVLGDNRDNSEDSRFTKVGFIPADTATRITLIMTKENSLGFPTFVPAQ